MIVVKNVYLSYTKEYYTLNNINIQIETGENIILYGEKESGKSSLLRIIAGLEVPTKGNVYLNNTDIKKVDFKNTFGLGYIGTSFVFLNNKSVKKNLEYVLKIRKVQKDVITAKVANALITYGLDNIQDKKAKDLTTFEKIKLSIARLSLRKIDLFLIDDIFDGLTKKEQDKIIYYLEELTNKDDVTSIIAVSNKKLADMLKGRTIKIKFGSIE